MTVQRVKSVKQLIKEKIIREIKKAIKNWILSHKWIILGAFLPSIRQSGSLRGREANEWTQYLSSFVQS